MTTFKTKSKQLLDGWLRMINLIVSDVSLFLCGFFAAFLFLYLRKHKAELSIIMSDLATVHQKLDKLIANIK